MRDALEEARQHVAAWSARTARRSSSLLVAPRPSTPLCGEPPGSTRAHRSSLPMSSTRPSAMPRRGLAPTEVHSGRRHGPAGRRRSGRASRRLRLPRPALVHCQWANHEVGTLQPVREVVELCRAADVPVHVDAAAACGHVAMDLRRTGRRPGQPQRPQNGRRAGCRRADRAARAAASNRSSWVANRSGRGGRAGGAAGAPGLRRGRGGTGADGGTLRQRRPRRRAHIAALIEVATAVEGVERGRPGGRRRAAALTWSASASKGSRPSPC